LLQPYFWTLQCVYFKKTNSTPKKNQLEKLQILEILEILPHIFQNVLIIYSNFGGSTVVRICEVWDGFVV
jgi:hypothetical protein